MALAVNEEEESEYDEEEDAMLMRRFNKSFSNNRYTNQRNNKDKKPSNTKSDYECHKCGSTDHFIKDYPTWKIEKARERQGKQEDYR